MKIITSHNVEINYSIASLQKRIKAYLIDILVKVIYITLLYIIILIANIYTSPTFAIIFFILPITFYSLLFEIFSDGQTIGKRRMNIQVTKLDGTQPSVGDYVLRWIACLLEFTLIQGLAVVVFLSNYKGQRLGDILAGTTVIDKEKEFSIEDTILHNTMDFQTLYTPTFPAVKQFTNSDIEIIKKVLNTYIETSDEKIYLALSSKIKKVLEMDPETFVSTANIETMIKDYNYYQQNAS